MTIASNRKSKACSAAMASLILGFSAVPAGAQQYYYQPSPGYYRNDTAEGTIVGGGLGALTGALIGGKKNWEGGALIGAGVGALTGRVIGSNRDRAEMRDVAVGSTVAAQANAQASAQAVSNYDLVQMTNAGISEDVIISTMRSRGGMFDLSPAGLIALKQAGVSDRVVIAAQSMGPSPGPVAINAPPVYTGPQVYHVASPPPIYVRPAPVIHYYYGPRWHGPCHHW